MRIENGIMISDTHGFKLDRIYFFTVAKTNGLYRLTCNIDIVNVELGACEDKKIAIECLNRYERKLKEAGFTNFARVGNELFNMDKVKEMQYQKMGNDHYIKIDFDKFEGYRHKKNKEFADRLIDQYYTQYNQYIDTNEQKV